MCEVLDRVQKRGEALGEARGKALGEALGEARGKALGEALGEARGKALGEARGIEINRLESIQSVMEGLGYTAQQAMDLLRIPPDEQPKFAEKL